MTNKKFIISALLLIMFFSLARLAFHDKVSAAPQTTAEVSIDNFSFSPTTLKVKPGTQIIWTNRDDIPHTVVSDDHKFKSRALDTDEKFTFTAAQPGIYSYFCSIHPKMTAKVVVE